MADTRAEETTITVALALESFRGDTIEVGGALYKMTGWNAGVAESWTANSPPTGATTVTNPVTGHVVTSVHYVRLR